MTDIHLHDAADKTLCAWPRLHGAEMLLVGKICLMALLVFALATLKEQAVAWGAFSISFLPAAGLLALGLYLRRMKPGLPHLAHLSIGLAIYLGFSGVIAIFIYLRFPISVPLIDPALIAIDRQLGYSWPQFVSTLSAYPISGHALGWVYHSSLPQLMALVAFLALSARITRLHQALFTGTISLLLACLIWWAWPSIGPSAHVTVDPEAVRAIGLFTDGDYGARLNALVQNGTSVIHPGDVIGTIAFPSYHTVMALLMVWYLRGTPLFIPALVLNLAMVPAILAHGGHHLSDMGGGIAIFVIAAALAARLAPAPR